MLRLIVYRCFVFKKIKVMLDPIIVSVSVVCSTFKHLYNTLSASWRISDHAAQVIVPSLSLYSLPSLILTWRHCKHSGFKVEFTKYDLILDHWWIDLSNVCLSIFFYNVQKRYVDRNIYLYLYSLQY